MGCICANPNEQDKLTEVTTKQQNMLETNDYQFKSKSLQSYHPCLEETNRDSNKEQKTFRKEPKQIDQLEKATSEELKQGEDNNGEEKDKRKSIKEDTEQQLNRQALITKQKSVKVNTNTNAIANANKDKSNEHEEPLDFANELLSLINKMRTNPRKYADYIEDSTDNIKIDKDNPIYLGQVKVKLVKGKEAFNEANEALRNISSMSPLTFKEDLCIKPPETKEQFGDKNYFSHQVDIIKSRINIKSYWKYQVNSPEIALLLMIVCDTKTGSKTKRNDLLNPNFRYIGISTASFGKAFNSYLTFTD